MTTTLPPDAQGFETHPAAAPPADLYRYAAIASEGVRGLAAVRDDHIRQFHEQGYLVVHDAFTPAEVQGGIDALVDLIDGKNPEFKGVIFEAAAREILPTLAPEQKQDAVRKLAWFVDFDARLKALAAHPALLEVVARIVEDTPHMFQDMALIKPPRIGREKPWHQDCAYFNLPLGTPVVGAWIALDEAKIENGCMHVIPGSQREGPVVHFQRRDWQICDTSVALERIVAVPLKPGGCLLFHGLLHHGTPPSRSTLRRRAVQFHYKPAGVPLGDDSAARLALFGSEGKDVEC